MIAFLLGTLGVFGVTLASVWALCGTLWLISYTHDTWLGADTDWDGDER